MYFPFFLYLMTPSTSPDTLLFVEFFLAVLIFISNRYQIRTNYDKVKSDVKVLPKIKL